MTPAMEAGLADHVWSVEELVQVLVQVLESNQLAAYNIKIP